ncbi:hypothetical protein ACLHDD_12665 [Pantoea sp. NSTU24]|uniref:hypothetical protein n=1 Tax=Pantoea sp. NSTU24 TaxID=3391144 RepID=UPI003D013A91
MVSALSNPYLGGSGDGGVSYWEGGPRSAEKTTSGAQAPFGAGGSGDIRSTPYINHYGSNGVIYIEETVDENLCSD